MNDEKIIDLFFSRSEDAIAETDKKYGECCRRTDFGILGDREDSEECVNDTYMKVWSAIPPARPDRLGAYVLKIVRNTALNILKHRGRLKQGGGYHSVGLDEIAELLPSPENVEAQADTHEALRAVERFVFSLSREKRIMFMRRYYYFRSCAEIAEELHMTEARVRTALHRIREKLRKYLEKEGIDV